MQRFFSRDNDEVTTSKIKSSHVNSIIHLTRRIVRADLAVKAHHPLPDAMWRFSELEETGHLPIAQSARVGDVHLAQSMLYSLVRRMKMLYHVHIKADSDAKHRSRLPMFHPAHLILQL